MVMLNPAKYPSTPYLNSLTKHGFIGLPVVITEKMDGENTSLYRDRVHARSIDSGHHESRSWVKSFHASIRDSVPPDLKICGENLYAKHSIKYADLPSYFLGFAVHDRLTCWSWDGTKQIFNRLGIEPVPVLFEGVCEAQTIPNLIKELDLNKSEGLVIRHAQQFPLSSFESHIAKWVRPGHVQTDEHWLHQEIEVNGLQTRP